MGYYVSACVELKIEPSICEGHRRLFNHFSTKILDGQNDYGGHWHIEEGKTEIDWEDDIGKSRIDGEVLGALIKQYLILWGYVVNGEAQWHGDSESDYGSIVVNNNHVQIRPGIDGYDLYCERYKKRAGSCKP